MCQLFLVPPKKEKRTGSAQFVTLSLSLECAKGGKKIRNDRLVDFLEGSHGWMAFVHQSGVADFRSLSLRSDGCCLALTLNYRAAAGSVVSVLDWTCGSVPRTLVVKHFEK